jgi:YgiT-type zinc finger domain-containing protein
MTKSTTEKAQRCAVCGGALRETTITHEEKRGGDLFVFEHVPAKLCSACGELWIEDATLKEIDRLIREGTPTRKVQTPVYDFAVVAAR